jgi:hypothetical protein
MVPLITTEVIAHPTCIRATDRTRPMTTFVPFLQCGQSYDSQWMAERVATHAVFIDPDLKNILDIVPIARAFFVTFSTVAFIETKVAKLSHEVMREMFVPAHDFALALLSDQTKKVFAPFFACLNDGRMIPEVLKKYVDEIT